MSTFKNKNSLLRIIEAEIAQKVKNNEARPKFTGSYKKKRIMHYHNSERMFLGYHVQCLAKIPVVIKYCR